jgi:hypothetical protein
MNSSSQSMICDGNHDTISADNSRHAANAPLVHRQAQGTGTPDVGTDHNYVLFGKRRAGDSIPGVHTDERIDVLVEQGQELGSRSTQDVPLSDRIQEQRVPIGVSKGNAASGCEQIPTQWWIHPLLRDQP